MKMMKMYSSKFNFSTPLGIAVVEGSKNGISRIFFSDDATISSEKVPEELQQAVTQLKEYFSGKRSNFQLKLNPAGTKFQQKVWKLLQEIPFGETVSYIEIANRLGDPKSIRAAASANGRNPLWIVVPCHRVIGSDGSLTGYAGGLWRKKWLLEHENPSLQQSLFSETYYERR